MDWSGVAISASVFGAHGAVVTQFSETLNGDRVTLGLSAAVTASLGPGTWVWALRVNDVYWLGGRFTLDYPGEDLDLQPSNTSVRVAISPYTVEVLAPTVPATSIADETYPTAADVDADDQILVIRDGTVSGATPAVLAAGLGVASQAEIRTAVDEYLVPGPGIQLTPSTDALTLSVEAIIAGENDVIWTDDDVGPVIESPDGSRYRIKVSNAGAVSTQLVSGGSTPPATVAFPNVGFAMGVVGTTPTSTDLNRVAAMAPGGGCRQDFSWSTIQPTQGTDITSNATWTASVTRLQEMLNAGLKPLPMLGYSPSWANGGQADNKYAIGSTFGDEWQLFCQEFAERAIPLGIRHFELWNEPNIVNFWKAAPNVTDYVTRCLIPGAAGLRAAATALGVTITVLTAGTAPASLGTVTPRTVTNKALASNVATLTTSVAHGITVGKTVRVAIGDAAFDGVYNVASVPTTTTLTFAKTGSNVTSAAASGTVSFGSGSNIDPRWWVEGLYSNGGQSSFDAVAHHPYTWPFPPTENEGAVADSLSQWNTMQQTIAMRATMVAKGDSAKQIWCTEVGVPSRDAEPTYPTTGHQNFVSHATLATRVNQIFDEWFSLDDASPGWIGPLLWYQHRNAASEPLGTNTEGGFGLIYNSGSDKPGGARANFIAKANQYR